MIISKVIHLTCFKPVLVKVFTTTAFAFTHPVTALIVSHISVPDESKFKQLCLSSVWCFIAESSGLGRVEMVVRCTDKQQAMVAYYFPLLYKERNK